MMVHDMASAVGMFLTALIAGVGFTIGAWGIGKVLP